MQKQSASVSMLQSKKRNSCRVSPQDLLLHLPLTCDSFQVMALRSVSLLLLVVVGLAHETAPSKPDATAAVGPANETSSTWSNFVYCKCGLTCVTCNVWVSYFVA